MTIWKIGPISEQPSCFIDDWCIKETDKGRYFVGTEVPGHTGRVSTAIVEYDPDNKCGRTKSGRVYKLGKPGYSKDGEYVWNWYKQVNELTEVKNSVDKDS